MRPRLEGAGVAGVGLGGGAGFARGTGVWRRGEHEGGRGRGRGRRCGCGRGRGRGRGRGCGRGRDGIDARGVALAQAADAAAAPTTQHPTRRSADADPPRPRPPARRRRTVASSSASRSAVGGREAVRRVACAIARITMASSAAGIARARARTRGGSGVSRSCLPITTTLDGPSKARVPGEHLVEHAAERVDVGAPVDRIAGDLLGRHVLGRAEDGEAAQRALLLGRLAVASPRSAPWRRRSRAASARPLDVRNRFCGLMSRCTRPAACAADSAVAASTPTRHGLAPVDRLPARAATSSVSPARSSIARYTRPSSDLPKSRICTRFGCDELRDRARLAAEALERRGRRRVLRREDLERHLPPELDVLRLPHDAARALADLAPEAVRRAQHHRRIVRRQRLGHRLADRPRVRRLRRLDALVEDGPRLAQQPRELGARAPRLVRPELAHERRDARPHAALARPRPPAPTRAPSRAPAPPATRARSARRGRSW